MGITVFNKGNKERELQAELQIKEIQIEQLEKREKELSKKLKAAQLIEQKDAELIEKALSEHESTLFVLKTEREEKETIKQELNEVQVELNKLQEEKNEIQVELNKLQEEKKALQKLLDELRVKLEEFKEKLKKKDGKIKEEQEKKSKYYYYYKNGAMDFTEAIALFNDLTDLNMNETKIRTFLVENNIIYKAGRYYAPTPYSEDFNYVVVYGDYGTTPPKYTNDFLRYLKEQARAGNLK